MLIKKGKPADIRLPIVKGDMGKMQYLAIVSFTSCLGFDLCPMNLSKW